MPSWLYENGSLLSLSAFQMNLVINGAIINNCDRGYHHIISVSMQICKSFIDIGGNFFVQTHRKLNFRHFTPFRNVLQMECVSVFKSTHKYFTNVNKVHVLRCVTQPALPFQNIMECVQLFKRREILRQISYIMFNIDGALRKKVIILKPK